MKGIKMKIFFLLLVFLGVISNIKAEDYECYYDANVKSILSSTKNITGGFKVLSDKKEISMDSYLWGLQKVPNVIDGIIDEEYNDSYIIDEILKGKCPDKIYVCYGQQVVTPGSAGATQEFLILNPDLIEKLKASDGYSSISSDGMIFSFEKYKDCVVGEYNGDKSTAPSFKAKFSCSKYDNLYGDMEDLYCSLSDEDCDLTKLEEYNKKKNELKNYCASVFKYQDYINPCIDKCSDFHKDIEKIEGTVDNQKKCGLSSKLIIWIANIVRWVKYIVPVLVIVLGILDFIRAMASDKDDEMKKAQGRFIKRLIAAALIFIAPFIIEFVLNKMGFASNGCGIIDL